MKKLQAEKLAVLLEEIKGYGLKCMDIKNNGILSVKTKIFNLKFC